MQHGQLALAMKIYYEQLLAKKN